MSLQGRTALVTGSTGEIGFAIVSELNKAGCTIVASDIKQRDIAENKFLALQDNKKIHYIQSDLKRSEGAVGLCRELDVICPEGVDILINVAGKMTYGFLVEEMSDENWTDELFLNLTIPFMLSKHVVPYMKKKKWGRIVNISSQLGLMGFQKLSAYVSSKSGLIGLTRAVALETAEYGVTCNSICPGPIVTPLNTDFFTKYSEELGISFDEAKIKLQQSQPTKAYTKVSQVSSLVLFLCSDGADNMTGTAIPMDGGVLAM